MANFTARSIAHRVLQRVSEGAYATLALSGDLNRLPDARDRSFATELVYGTLRMRRRIDVALAAGAPRGLDLDEQTMNVLRISAYEILFLRTPAHAAVNEAVETFKRLRNARLAGFANALLRRLAREGEPPLPDDSALALAIAESAPDWLVALVTARFSVEEAEQFLAALNRPAPLWLRTNCLRTSSGALAAELQALGFGIDRSPLVEEALQVSAGENIFRSDPFVAGKFVAQDLAAQLAARLLDPQPGEVILDACAGVGGKATHLAELSDDRARIDAADHSERKLELCADTAHRLGLSSLRTTVCDVTQAGAPIGESYHRILLDAPCSGLGVLRRHPEAKWRPFDNASLVATQKNMLNALAPRVRPGGVLVYSVCTFTDEEGPRQIAAFLQRHPEFSMERLTESFAGLGDESGAIRTWPHRHDADAFYLVRLRKC